LVIVSTSPEREDVYLFNPPEVEPELQLFTSFPSMEKLFP
jgi:hypothetical protein